MKKQMNLIALGLLLGMVSCTSESTTSTSSEIIQHPTAKVSLDGPEKEVLINTEPIEVETTPEIIPETRIKEESLRTKKVNQAPQKSLEELRTEVAQLEEQGGLTKADANLYRAYGDALVVAKDYKEAVEMYKKAEDLGYEDMKTLAFDIAKTYAQSDKSYGSIEDYLLKARKLGFRNYRALLYDPAFANLRDDYDFMYIYKEIFGEKQKAMFKALVTLAPRTTLRKDYVMGPRLLFENTSYEYRKEQDFYKKHPIINGYFEEFIEGVADGMFSRGGGDNFRYEKVLTNNENYVAIIYSREEEWTEQLLPKEYMLITFDREGNKLSELSIAKRGSMKKCKGFVLHPDNSLEVTNFAIKWKKGRQAQAEEADRHLKYDDLQLAEAGTTQSYKINAIGRIVEVDNIMLGMK